MDIDPKVSRCASSSQFLIYLPWVNAHCTFSIVYFNQKEALVGAFPVIVKSSQTFVWPSFEALLLRPDCIITGWCYLSLCWSCAAPCGSARGVSGCRPGRGSLEPPWSWRRAPRPRPRPRPRDTCYWTSLSVSPHHVTDFAALCCHIFTDWWWEANTTN